MEKLIAQLGNVIADDQHHDGAIIIRKALVSLFYKGPKWNFPICDLRRLDGKNFRLFQTLLNLKHSGQHHELADLAEIAKAYLLRHKEV